MAKKNIKRFLLRVLSPLLKVDPIWKVLGVPSVVAGRVLAEGRGRELTQKFCGDAQNLVVADGPFKGLKYPTAESTWSTLMPKLLGTYECELDDFIMEACQTNFPVIVDVGCAEGYYAVGFAMRCSKSRVIAFDINEKAQEMCREMAKCNGVSEQIELRGECDGNSLIEMARQSVAGGLIISDCEGYEKELFSKEVIAACAHWTVLIEIHEIASPGVGELLKERFKETHDLEVVWSVSDSDKGRELKGFPKEQAEVRTYIAGERRKVRMPWFILRPKN